MGGLWKKKNWREIEETEGKDGGRAPLRFTGGKSGSYDPSSSPFVHPDRPEGSIDLGGGCWSEGRPTQKTTAVGRTGKIRNAKGGGGRGKSGRKKRPGERGSGEV